MPEHILILWFPGSDDYQLGKFIYQSVHDGIDQIQPLLIGQTGNESDHVFLLIYFQTKFFLQPFFVHILLFPETGRIIIHVNLGIGLWIVSRIINSVYNSLHVKMTCRQQAI